MGCVEKADLLRALCKYYGVDYQSVSAVAPSSSSASSSRSHDSYAQGENCQEPFKQQASGSNKTSNMNMTAETLRKVMKSR